MRKPLKLYGLVPAVILGSALAGCATYGKYASDSASDAKVTANVQTAINQHPELAEPDSIQVQTIDHVVYLNGIVSEGLQSREAEAVAQQTPGVARVVNQLAVSK
jgi:osmotically-inducible protein OsmY